MAGRGSEPVRRRCPETPPKVRAIHGAISGGPNSELIKALKKVCPPPLNLELAALAIIVIDFGDHSHILNRNYMTATGLQIRLDRTMDIRSRANA